MDRVDLAAAGGNSVFRGGAPRPTKMGGQTLPSTKTLLRYAEATGSKFHVRLSAA